MKREGLKKTPWLDLYRQGVRLEIPPDRLTAGQKGIVGIIGGVGPESHADYEKILFRRNQERRLSQGLLTGDQQHPFFPLLNATPTPDRTANIKGEGPDPLPYLLDYTQFMEFSGCQAVTVVCNTSHRWHQAVQKDLGIPWIHMMQVTAADILKTSPQVHKVGILGTTGTNKIGLYHKALRDVGLTPIAPNLQIPEEEAMQEKIHAAIYDPRYGIKFTPGNVSARAQEDLVIGIKWCQEQGAQGVIAACTEISIAIPIIQEMTELPIIDPLRALADVALDIAWGIREPRDFFVRD